MPLCMESPSSTNEQKPSKKSDSDNDKKPSSPPEPTSGASDTQYTTISNNSSVLSICSVLGMMLFSLLAVWFLPRFGAAINDVTPKVHDASTPKVHDASPLLVNREIEVRLSSHWQTYPTSPLCETYGFLLDSSDPVPALESYLNNLVADDAGYVEQFSDGLSLSLKAAGIGGVGSDDLEETLLSYSLKMRVYSPLCELHSKLAYENINSGGEDMNSKRITHAVYRQRVVTSISELVHALETSNNAEEDVEILPDEAALGRGIPTIFFYSNFNSQEFREWHAHLQSLTNTYRLVYRYLGGGSIADETNKSKTYLQGYGVRLDMRNTEYRAFDDAEDDNWVYGDTVENISSGAVLAGMNSTLLQIHEDASETKETGASLAAKLATSHLHQIKMSRLIPPPYQRRNLPLQATQAISQHTDTLFALRDIAQNLPSKASALSTVAVTKTVRSAVEALYDVIPSLSEYTSSGGRGRMMMRGPGQGAPFFFFVNGRLIPVQRPSFNVFELLDILRQEDDILFQLESAFKGYPVGALEAVRDILEGSDSTGTSEDDDDEEDDDEEDDEEPPLRIDVGRGGRQAILYVNDIEKDARYRSWSRSVMPLMFGGQFGPPSIRRNLFTFLIAYDPFSSKPLPPALMFGMELMQNGFPVRLGLLFISDNDTNNSNDNDGSSSLKQDIDSSSLSLSGRATIKDVHTLFFEMLKEDGFLAFSFLLNYHEQLSSSIAISREELVKLYLDFMKMASQSRNARSAAASHDILNKPDEAANSSFKAGIKFANDKGIPSGATFINGRPIPVVVNDNGEEEATKRVRMIFQEEMMILAEMVQEQRLTDDKPRSVYAMILSGKNLFETFHPMLLEEPKYTIMESGGSLTSLMSVNPDSTANFDVSSFETVITVEALLDMTTEIGQACATAIREYMESSDFHNFVRDNKIDVAYRIRPNVLGIDNGGKGGIDSTLPEDVIVVNGRVLGPARMLVTPTLKMDIATDIRIGITLELVQSKITSRLLREHFSSSPDLHDAVFKVNGFLGEQTSSDIERIGVEQQLKTLVPLNSPIHYLWNHHQIGSNLDGKRKLRVKVTVLMDPLSEASQRASPLLITIRDQLKIPLRLVLAPRINIKNDDKSMPISSFYRFVSESNGETMALFQHLPTNHVLTLKMDVPEQWDVQQVFAIQDTDNLRCESGKNSCGDDTEKVAQTPDNGKDRVSRDVTKVEYGLKGLLFFGQCYETETRTPPTGLQFTLANPNNFLTTNTPGSSSEVPGMEILADGSQVLGDAVKFPRGNKDVESPDIFSDTLVMTNLGYWQIKANPGVWDLSIAQGSRGSEMYGISVNGTSKPTKTLVMKDFVNRPIYLNVIRKPGFEDTELLDESTDTSSSLSGSLIPATEDEEVIHVFSLATGHLYERFLKIMMLSVTKRTSVRVKFWLFENFLSPLFKSSALAMADAIGCDIEFVTYKWPEWLRGQSEKQRIIWGYKILFLDVLFPLSVKRIIYVDADQVVRGDLKELWDMDLEGNVYGYTPFCDSRETTLGYQFWRTGFWKSHLRGKPYHISALYVVDLQLFRQQAVGDKLRGTYQQLSADPNSLSNLDQDLPNYAQHEVPIFSLPQEWLWCESWCSDATKPQSKTIDLCNNPMHKEPKLTMAKRVIQGELFDESWVELDEEVKSYELSTEYRSYVD